MRQRLTMKLTARWTTLLAAALVLASASGCSALYPFDGNPEDRRDGAVPDAAPAQCGNNICESGEDCYHCPADCGPCGCNENNVCESDEDVNSCEWDCYCNNGSCDLGEDCDGCPGDCGPCTDCGDGTCDPGEDCYHCPADCGACVICGDGTCDAAEDCTSCPADCGACVICGDGTCDAAEDCTSCPDDCGPCFCGNGTCDPAEDCTSCPGDCGPCTDCGNGMVELGEQCDDGNTVNGDGCDGNCQFEQVLFYDPMDSFASGWQPSGDWSTGFPDYPSGPPACVEGGCAGTNLYGDYQPGHDWGTCILDSPVYHFPINPSPGSGLYLSFWGWIGMAPGDCARVIYSIDGGLSWDILHFEKPTDYNSNAGGSACFSPGSFLWENYYAKILGIWTGPVDVLLQFEIYTMGGSGTAPGFYVDELRLVSMQP